MKECKYIIKELGYIDYDKIGVLEFNGEEIFGYISDIQSFLIELAVNKLHCYL